MTINELAEAIDKSVQFLSMLERGERSASLETVAQLAKALSVTPAELLAEGERAKARDSSRGEEIAVLLEPLSEEQVNAIVGIVRELRDLLLPKRKSGRRR